MIEEAYVSFEIAKLLKEKKFNYPCRAVYSPKGIVRHYLKEEVYAHHLKGHKKLCPTLQMAMKWLRGKEYVICVIPLTFYFGENVSSWGYNVWAGDNLEVDDDNTPKFTTYEEACEAAIKYCLENLI